jgi:hypothetical protein
VLIPSSVFMKGSSNARNGFPNIILEVIFFTKIKVVLKHISLLQTWALDILYSIFNLVLYYLFLIVNLVL